ncbi:MAG: hypothetical protein K2H33_07855 [Muribaculaceae bacterium]|nr:hypothetical protein [Muribaculaceae bacterium]MDE6119324.1 hypothetical protein [Muribaculaceae bacterium]
MKALICDCNPAGFRMVADSAIGRNGQPWFVPDFGSAWRWKVMVAVRIGRLGKCIAPKFARRYFDSMTLLFVPECDAPEASVLLGCMDGAAVCGSWVDITESVRVDSAESVGFHEFGFEALAALVSRCVTLKTGDLLAVDLPDVVWRDALAGCRVNSLLNGTPVLSFNIK